VLPDAAVAKYAVNVFGYPIRKIQEKIPQNALQHARVPEFLLEYPIPTRFTSAYLFDYLIYN